MVRKPFPLLSSTLTSKMSHGPSVANATDAVKETVRRADSSMLDGLLEGLDCRMRNEQRNFGGETPNSGVCNIDNTVLPLFRSTE